MMFRNFCADRILGFCIQGAGGRVTFTFFNGACSSMHDSIRVVNVSSWSFGSSKLYTKLNGK